MRILGETKGARSKYRNGRTDAKFGTKTKVVSKKIKKKIGEIFELEKKFQCHRDGMHQHYFELENSSLANI